MAAMKRDDQLAVLQQPVRADEAPRFVRQHEGRQTIADRRRGASRAGIIQARDHAVDDIGETGIEAANVIGQRR